MILVEKMDSKLELDKSNSSLEINSDVKENTPNTNCMLLEDMTTNCIPIHLNNILNHFNPDELSQGELLFLLIYTIAIESGYVCERVYEQMEDAEEPMADLTPTMSFNIKNVITCSLVQPIIITMSNKSRLTMKLRFLVNTGVNIRTDHDLIVQLTGFLSGDIMIVTFIPDVATSEVGTSIALPLSRYILSDWAKGKHLSERYMKIKELLRIIRDELLLPIRNQQLNVLQANIYPSIDALPLELYDKILQHLCPVHLRNLALVNRRMRSAVLCSKYSR